MHAQRCPMAKLRAASQQSPEVLDQATKHKSTKTSILPSVIKRVTERKKKHEKFRRGQRNHSARSQERPSFFQKLHGDAASCLPPRPQMYSDDTWKTNQCRVVSPVTQQIFYSDAAHKLLLRTSGDQPLIYNENCEVHGRNSSHSSSMSKSVSCSSAVHSQPRQNVSGERLKNWRRNSFTFTTASKVYNNATARRHVEATHRSVSLEQDLQCLPSTANQKRNKPRKSTSVSSSLSSAVPSSTSFIKSDAAFHEDHNRRSHFRRAWSLFSIACNEVEKEKPPPQKILRQPTRHVYRRGISGLPIECTNRHIIFS
nr:uncharacterized protein LOC128692129 [Cherax quadricarinatus]XP_053637122.1 uncharacterized protein LOC128692129 [Cherax quadricarinatus]XP_053637123.1 uncharacterized protein LOC128692129 [Cherax quadricarinatus]